MRRFAMIQGPLFQMHIDDGKRLLDVLAAEGIPVTAAAWVKEADGRCWHLYLVTPLVTIRGGKKAAHVRLNEVIDGMGDEWPYWSAIHVFNPKSHTAAAIAEIQRHGPEHRPVTYGFDGGQLGNIEVEGVYIYPVAEAVS